MRPEDFIIGADMDDTLTKLIVPWYQWLNNKYKKHVDPYADIHWNPAVQYPDLAHWEIFQPLFIEEFWDKVTPIDGAVYYVKKLIDEGFQFYVVTSSHHDTVSAKFNRVLFKYFPFIDRHNIITTSNKQLIKCHVLIDDGPHNIVGDYHGVLMEAAHNRHWDETLHPHVVRVRSWKEAYEQVHKIYDELCQTQEEVVL